MDLTTHCFLVTRSASALRGVDDLKKYIDSVTSFNLLTAMENPLKMPLSKRHFLGLSLAMSVSTAIAEDRPLAFGTSPEQAPKLAETAVDAIEKWNGQRLDYSPASLQAIDRLVLVFRDEGKTPSAMTATLLTFGCYVGEVLARHLSLRWDRPSKVEYDLGFTSIGLRAKDGSFTDPIGKVFKLLLNGKEDSVVFLYSVAAQKYGPGESTDTFSIHQRVRHPKFGNGVVDAVAGKGDDERVQVRFDSGEVKWLAVKYARLEPISSM